MLEMVGHNSLDLLLFAVLKNGFPVILFFLTKFIIYAVDSSLH